MNRDMLLGVHHLVMAACGTSLYASMYGQLLMQSLATFDTVEAVDASELSQEGFPQKVTIPAVYFDQPAADRMLSSMVHCVHRTEAC